MDKRFNMIATAGLALAVGGCASVPAMGDPAVSVYATAETAPVGTANEDAADDPAIWRNPADPSKSLIVSTDKKGGLYVYNLMGEQLAFMAAPGLNNVDLVEMSDGGILVLASDRRDRAAAHIQLAMLDPTTGKLVAKERVSVGPGEGYGICVGAMSDTGTLDVYSAPKEGTIYRTRLTFAAGSVSSETTTLASVPSQPEGCVFDQRTGTLYVGEEAAGIWAIEATTGTKTLVARTNTGMLVPDVEGLALAPEGENGGYLVASSQGDNAYAVYRLPEMEPVGRFRIAQGAFGSTEETDGIELDNRSFGPDYPQGLFIAQDGINSPDAQNFKLVSWGAILKALGAE
ncbi:phytase [Citromicrobium bathyomarinum]|uniref:phytase n=1 Tax=Citromicrobium bathyomarinum TaxID=72174 RepID=UPI00315A61E1